MTRTDVFSFGAAVALVAGGVWVYRNHESWRGDSPYRNSPEYRAICQHLRANSKAPDTVRIEQIVFGPPFRQGGERVQPALAAYREKGRSWSTVYRRRVVMVVEDRHVHDSREQASPDWHPDPDHFGDPPAEKRK